jgi:DNA polymerase-3 subunit beta
VKFRCERDVLAEALAAAGRAATGRSGSLPVLSGLRLELKGDRLTVTGSDLELTVQYELTVDGQQDGGVVVPKLLSDIVRSFGDPKVEISVEGENIDVAAGRSRFAIRPLAFDDYPRVGSATASSVTLPAADFVEALRQVVRAASPDEQKPQLTGVLMAAEAGGLRLVATDSYRLAVRDLSGTTVLGTDQQVLVPARALQEVIRLANGAGELTLRLGERDATFEVASARVTTRLIEQQFPNYKQLMPQPYPNMVTIDKEAFNDALRRVRLLARDTIPVRLTLGGDLLRLEAISNDKGTVTEEVDATFSGTEMTIAFNAEYLASGIDACTGEQITLSTQRESNRPAVLRGAGHEDYFYLLMPQKV